MTDFIQSQKKKAVLDILNNLKSEFNITSSDLVSILVNSDKDRVPLEIFGDRDLSVMQALVKYLKENLGYSNKQISELLQKDVRSVWDAYKKASARKKSKFEIKNSILFIPIDVFKGSTSLLGVLVSYLRNLGWPNQKVAKILNRTDTTISTVYKRIENNG